MTTTRPELDFEYSNWKDSGCELYPSCLDCPRPRCIEEEQRGRQRIKMDSRSKQMIKLKEQGMSIAMIAVMFGVSTRTVQRALSPRQAKGGTRYE